MIKIEHTINSIIKNKEFDYKTDSISMNSNHIPVVYNNKSVLEGNNLSNSPIINEYLKAISKFNVINKGISINYSNIIGFNFNSEIINFLKIRVGTMMRWHELKYGKLKKKIC